MKGPSILSTLASTVGTFGCHGYPRSGHLELCLRPGTRRESLAPAFDITRCSGTTSGLSMQRLRHKRVPVHCGISSLLESMYTHFILYQPWQNREVTPADPIPPPFPNCLNTKQFVMTKESVEELLRETVYYALSRASYAILNWTNLGPYVWRANMSLNRVYLLSSA